MFDRIGERVVLALSSLFVALSLFRLVAHREALVPQRHESIQLLRSLTSKTTLRGPMRMWGMALRETSARSVPTGIPM